MPTPNNDRGPTRRSRILIAAIITVVLIGFVLVHLTGAIGPGSH